MARRKQTPALLPWRSREASGSLTLALGIAELGTVNILPLEKVKRQTLLTPTEQTAGGEVRLGLRPSFSDGS